MIEGCTYNGAGREDGALVSGEIQNDLAGSLAWTNKAGNESAGLEGTLGNHERLDLGVGVGDEQAGVKGQHIPG
jgi:hypothetical protein